MNGYHEPYTRQNSLVKKSERKLHEDFIAQVMELLDAKGYAKNKMTIAMGTDAPMTYRILNPDKTIDINSMSRAAEALDADIEIKLVPRDPSKA